nr:uncharacterized protein LOC112764209 isoform X4 [Arachis hypogaea]XP_029150248.1 uncharacterized protein LOC112764209 isoform X4 [Arachis hypogaea]
MITPSGVTFTGLSSSTLRLFRFCLLRWKNNLMVVASSSCPASWRARPWWLLRMTSLMVYHRRTDAPSTIHSSTTLALHKLFWTHLRCRLLYRIWPNLFRLPIALRKALMVNRISCDSDSDMSLVHKLTSDTLIEVSIEIPFAFRVIPKQAIESAGTQVLEQILRIMLPRFMSQLVKDYHAWASGDTSREPLGTGEI